TNGERRGERGGGYDGRNKNQASFRRALWRHHPSPADALYTRAPLRTTRQKQASLNARYGKFTTELFRIEYGNRPSICILVGGFNQDFPLTGMIRLADHALRFHAFHQRGGTVVANLQPPLNIAGRSLAVARHNRHRLLIKIAALARSHRG